MTYTWTHKELDTEFNCTFEELKGISEALNVDGETLADLLTGYTCDSYADDAEIAAQDSEGERGPATQRRLARALGAASAAIRHRPRGGSLRLRGPVSSSGARDPLGQCLPLRHLRRASSRGRGEP